MRCPNCGAEIIDENADFCTNCGARLIKSNVKMSEPKTEPIHVMPNTPSDSYSNPGSSYSGNSYSNGNGYSSPIQASQPVSPKQIKLSEGEVLVRRYHLTSSRFHLSNGYVYVTNKRVLYQGIGWWQSYLTQEVNIDSVSGITTYTGRNLNILALVVAIISFISFVIGMNISAQAYRGSGAGQFALLSFLICVLAVIFLVRKTCLLALYSSKATGTPIVAGEGAKSWLGNSAVVSLSARPTPEAAAMFAEIGAMVLDLQQFGDKAIEKWKR